MSLLGDKLKAAGIYKPDNERIWNWLKDQTNPRTVREIGMALSLDFPPVEAHLKEMCKRDMVIESVKQFHGHAHSNVATMQYNTAPGLKEFEVLPYHKDGVVAKATAQSKLTLPASTKPKASSMLGGATSTRILQLVSNAPSGILVADIAKALKLHSSGVNAVLRKALDEKKVGRHLIHLKGYLYYLKIHEALAKANSPTTPTLLAAAKIELSKTAQPPALPQQVVTSDLIAVNDLDSVLAKMPLGAAQEMYLKLHKIFGR